MKRLNHITLLLISFILCLGSVFLLYSSKEKMATSFNEYYEIKQLSNKYQTKKIKWLDSERTEKKLTNIINSVKFKNITKKRNNKFIDITIKGASIKKIDKFLNKILNESLIINTLEFDNDTLKLQIGYK